MIDETLRCEACGAMNRAHEGRSFVSWNEKASMLECYRCFCIARNQNGRSRYQYSDTSQHSTGDQPSMFDTE